MISKIKEVPFPDFFTSVTPSDNVPSEIPDEKVEYKDLTIKDFEKASTFNEVITVAQHGKFNLMDEGKRILANKEKEVVEQTHKYNNWLAILGLLSLKLNNQ